MARYFYDAVSKQYIEVEEDNYSASPREWAEYSRFLTFGNNYASPDAFVAEEFSDWEEMGEFFGAEFQFGSIEEDIVNLLKASDSKGYVLAPVYRYEHSGVAYSTKPFNCKWDSGLAGVIYIDKLVAQKELALQSTDAILERLSDEVSEYSRWANGEDIYSCVLFNSDGEEIDSIYGEWLNWDYGEDLKGLAARVCNDYILGVDDEDMVADNLEDLGEYHSIGEAIFYREKLEKRQKKCKLVHADEWELLEVRGYPRKKKKIDIDEVEDYE